MAGVGERGRHGREAARRARQAATAPVMPGAVAGLDTRRRSEAPWKISSLWANCRWGRTAVHGLAGLDRAPRSCTGRGRCSRSRRRTMNGTLDARVGGRGRDVGRRVRRVVGLKLLRCRVGRLVEVAEARRLVALRVDRRRLTLPGLQLRPREHRTAVGVVDQLQAATGSVRQRRADDVAPEVKASEQADEAVTAVPEGPGNGALPALPRIDGHLDVTGAANPDLDQRVVVADQVGAAGEHRDRRPWPCRLPRPARRAAPRSRAQPKPRRRSSDAHRDRIRPRLERGVT